MTNEKQLIYVRYLIQKLEAEKSGCEPVTPDDDPLVKFQKRVIPKLLQNVIDYIASIPTVDAVEVVHARWEHNGTYGEEVCSNCGFEWWDGCQECGVCPSDTFYCPNCGAKMDGVEDGK